MNDEQIARQLLQLAYSANEHGIVLLDLEGRVTWWSPGAEKLFSMSAEEAKGIAFREIFTAADQDIGIDQLEVDIARAGAISEDDRWHRRADGSKFWSTGALETIEDSAGHLIGYGKILRDRTNLAEQLRFLRARAERANEIASVHAITIAKLSHEIRNATMALTAGIRQLEQPTLPDEQQRHVTHLMKSQIEVLKRLSEDLISARRDRSEKVLAESRPIAVQDLLKEIVDNVSPRLVSRRMTILAPAAPIVVNGDRVRLLQAFGNVVDNAIKYTLEDGQIWVKATVEADEAVIHVEDDGHGIPPAMLSKIFELFTQVDPSSEAGGLGVGLAIVHEVAMLHGGSVQARSEGSNRGSTFTMRLPLFPRHGESSPTEHGP